MSIQHSRRRQAVAPFVAIPLFSAAFFFTYSIGVRAVWRSSTPAAAAARPIHGGAGLRAGSAPLHVHTRPTTTTTTARVKAETPPLGTDPTVWYSRLDGDALAEYRDLFAGIDLAYRRNAESLTARLTVRPGADPLDIHLDFADATSLTPDASGAIVVRTGIENVSGHISFTDLDIYNDFGAGLFFTGLGPLNAIAGTGSAIRVTAGVATIASGFGPAVKTSNVTLDLQGLTMTSTNSFVNGLRLASLGFETYFLIANPNATEGSRRLRCGSG